MHTILFTGGGSAGHVTPNIALIQEFQAAGWQVIYAGSNDGIERNIIGRLNIPYFGVSTGKLRRYFSWRTFVEPFAILWGIVQAFLICKKTKPDVLFSKGGFVAFPIVMGAWLNRIPVTIHESDFTPGLANKLSFPFADRIFVTFAQCQEKLSSKKTLVTGTPIRASLLQGKKDQGLRICQFDSHKPVLLIIGGGQGAAFINDNIRRVLPNLLKHFQVAHICGQGKLDLNTAYSGYKQFEYLNEELADVFACCDLVISRAGANSLYELLRLKKPHILIPLARRASRGDQIVNATYFAQQGLSNVLYEEDLTSETLLELIMKVYQGLNEQRQRLENFSLPESNQIIYQELIQLAKNDIPAEQ